MRKTALVLGLCMVLFWLAVLVGHSWANGDRHGRNGKEHTAREEFSEALGSVTLAGMVLVNTLYYYGMAVRIWRSRSRQSIPELFKKPLQWKTRFRNFHYIGNPVLIGLAFWHGWWAEEGNVLLWGGWGLMLFLALSGLTMKLQGADQPGARVSRLIHFQHSFAVIMALVLVAGHLLAD